MTINKWSNVLFQTVDFIAHACMVIVINFIDDEMLRIRCANCVDHTEQILCRRHWALSSQDCCQHMRMDAWLGAMVDVCDALINAVRYVNKGGRTCVCVHVSDLNIVVQSRDWESAPGREGWSYWKYVFTYFLGRLTHVHTKRIPMCLASLARSVLPGEAINLCNWHVKRSWLKNLWPRSRMWAWKTTCGVIWPSWLMAVVIQVLWHQRCRMKSQACLCCLCSSFLCCCSCIYIL